MTTVAELIEVLKTKPPNLRVILNGYEWGYCDLDLKEIEIKKIKLNVHKQWWYGEHDDADSTEQGLPIEDALLLCCCPSESHPIRYTEPRQRCLSK